MALTFPNYPENVGGDEPTLAPTKNDRGLLGAERGTQFTRRIETDADRNLFVHIAADDVSAPAQVSPLASNGVVNTPDNVLTTVVTYTAPAAIRLSRISFSGTAYAKFQIFLNTVLVETYRTGPHRSGEFNFTRPLGLDASDILDVKVTHYGPGVLADFESTVYGG